MLLQNDLDLYFIGKILRSKCKNGYVNVLSMCGPSISMDFNERLPKSQEKTMIMVVVDELRKYAHFTTLIYAFTVAQNAKVFMHNIY